MRIGRYIVALTTTGKNLVSYKLKISDVLGNEAKHLVHHEISTAPVQRLCSPLCNTTFGRIKELMSYKSGHLAKQ